MAQIILPPPSFEEVEASLAYDPATGEFTRKIDRGGMKAGSIAGYVASRGYVYISVKNRRLLGHRLAWLLAYGVWPSDQVDHINGDKKDNRIANLRDVTAAVNQQNQKGPRRDNKVGFMGVSKVPGPKPFAAKIRHSGKQHILGYFDTPEAAHTAYISAKREFHVGNTL